MRPFDPLTDIENNELILDDSQWPNFHDAEVHNLSIWRGDVRPEDDVYIGPVLTASFELCALQYPFIAELKFHDCVSIDLQAFNHQNAVFDLLFEFEDRGTLLDGSPMTPYIVVRFEEAFGAALSFKCFRVEVVARREPASAELDTLLAALSPRLLTPEFVFCTLPGDESACPVELSPIATFREAEGLTLVLELASAEQAGLSYASVFRCITLGVHSSLDAVGLTAAVSGVLARRGISANVMAAYHHDHIFVPAAQAHDALIALQGMGNTNYS